MDEFYNDDFPRIGCNVMNNHIEITTECSNDTARKCPKCGVLFIQAKEK
jgi:hypothetical protein